MATMVFKTLRVGFPKANVVVYLNDLDDASENTLLQECGRTMSIARETHTIHHEWIERLVLTEDEPFYLVDSDTIFYSSFERFDFTASIMAGRRIPEWRDSFSGCITRARLHTSLLYIDPVKVRQSIFEYHAKIADTIFTPKSNLIYPLVVPFKGNPFFYDTCSLLYHAIGGTAFTDEHKEKYCHFDFGSIPDVILPRLPKEEALQLERARKAIIADPSVGIGAFRSQDEFYLNHPV